MKNSYYDAILVVSFGGPEGMDEVMPFLDRVLCGRGASPERKNEVASHYKYFQGISPINQCNQQLIKYLRIELQKHDISLPIYLGNRNWHPLLSPTIEAMASQGIQKILAFVTSAYSSYSGCRQYRENILDACCNIENSPVVDKIRVFYNHPLFVAASVARVQEALQRIPPAKYHQTKFIFTTHSLPLVMTKSCDYILQLQELCSLIIHHIGWEYTWKLVYQSGANSSSWIGPDICDYLPEIKQQGITHVVVVPIGFLCDHIEVLYDLDIEAKKVCRSAGINMERAKTVGTHPQFIAMIRALIQERLDTSIPRCFSGKHGAYPDECSDGCCLPS